MDRLPAAVVVFDSKGNVLKTNRYGEKWFGLRAKDYVKLNIFDYLTKESKARAIGGIKRALTGHADAIVKYEVKSKTGKRFFITVRSKAIIYRKKKAVLCLVTKG